MTILEELQTELNDFGLRVNEMGRLTVSRKCNMLSDFLLEQLNLKSDGNNLYVFNGKIYAKMDESTRYTFLRNIYLQLFNDWGSRRFKEISKDLIYRTKDENLGKIDDYYVPFKNCIYSLKDNATIDYSPEILCTNTLNYEYTEEDPTLFIETMKQTLPLKESRDKFLTYIRYCLTPTIKHQKALICIGGGANGKTVLVEFIMDLMGDLAIKFDMGRLHGSEASSAITQLKGKNLAVMSELGGVEYINPDQQESLKEIITDRHLIGREKYEKSMRWNNTTKFLVTTNELPIPGNTHKRNFWRRWDIVEFTEVFMGDDADEELYDRIKEQEASKVLSYLVRYDGEYDFNPDWEDIKMKWLNTADPVIEWTNESFLKIEKCNTSFSRAYKVYCNWCRVNDKHMYGKKAFKRHVSKCGYQIEKHNDRLMLVDVTLAEDT